MTYHSGTSGLGHIGIPDDVPRIVCDGCGRVHRIAQGRPPPTWFLDGKAPKGWRRDREELSGGRLRRRDFCPECRRRMEERR